MTGIAIILIVLIIVVNSIDNRLKRIADALDKIAENGVVFHSLGEREKVDGSL